MIAAVLYKQKSPLIIEKLFHSKLDYGQVLVKIFSSGVCGRQIQEIYGHKGKDKFLPHTLGHEGGGKVLKIGPGVSKCKPGDRVVLHWRPSKGIQSVFPYYLNKKKKRIGSGLISTFSSESVVSENRLTVIKEKINYDTLALLGCSLTTALGIVNKEANIQIGQSVLISGAGSVGLSLVQACQLVSANPVIVSDIKQKKLNFAKKLKADFTINCSKKDIVDEVMKINGSKGIDYIFETSGNVDVIKNCYDLLAPNGRLVLVGQPSHNEKITLQNLQNNFQGKMIFDSQGGLTDPDYDIFRYINLIKNKKLFPEKIVTNNIKINNLNKYIKMIHRGEILGKTIINF